MSFPVAILPELRKHLDRFSGDGPSGLVFPNEHGAPFWRGNFNKAVAWVRSASGSAFRVCIFMI